MKVAILGSGNWGSAIANIVGRNQTNHQEVRMWVYDEQVDGRSIIDIINEEHENTKYLPGVKFPNNVFAVGDPVETVLGATHLIFVLPHQFLPRLCATLKGHVDPAVKCISLIKGLEFTAHGPQLCSEIIMEKLGVDNCSVLMGANVASEVAEGQFCEATLGVASKGDGKAWKDIFHTPFFRVEILHEVVGVEMCGALKNVVALGAGLCDGLGYGGNTKSALMRVGFSEMRKFIKSLYPATNDEVYFQSCGVADLITTCYGGRNRKCAAEYGRCGGSKSISDIETELLGGQKLQGTVTLEDVMKVLRSTNATAEFPLFSQLYEIFYEGANPETVVKF